MSFKSNWKYGLTTLGLSVLIFCFILLVPLQGKDDNKSTFNIKADGSVEIEGHHFANMTDYLLSDYFRETGKRCGTGLKAPISRDLSAQLASTSDCTLSRTSIKDEYYPSQTYTVRVVFHVIYKSDGTGNISEQRIKDQVTVMNQDYGAIAGTMGANGYNTKIQFSLKGITRTQNDSWFSDSNESAYKASLGWNQSQYLNIYVNNASGFLGYAYLPQEMAGNTLDGVVILYESVGGRNNGFSTYDQGRTLVHEVGHYLGLLHTFEDYACNNSYTTGDLIVDTNSENDEHYGCSSSSSCGTTDPIHNYMNYTDDSCMTEFTQEQANRLVCSLVNYRPNVYTAAGGSSDSISLTSPNGGENWTKGSTHSITWTSSGSISNVKIQYSLNNGSSYTTITSSTSNDGSYSWTLPNTTSSQCLVKIQDAADGTPSDTSASTFTISASGGGGSGSTTIDLNRTQFYFAATGSSNKTANQYLRIDNSGSGTLSWSASDNKSWLSLSPSSGTGSGVVAISVNPSGMSAGSYTGTITVSDSNASNSPQTVTVYLTVKSSWQDEEPFGVFATPASGSSASSSIPVTGWVLDDVGVDRVEIYNGSSYIGDAVFVEGARPDVVNAFPYYPANYQAGWGYMLLTNFLPNGGNGTYTLTVKATDTAGHTVTLGSHVVYIDNDNAVKPFGAIDTPAQGGNASGSNFVNWGWALTPQPNKISTDGSTLKVYVDGVFLGNPTYNIYRSDIATKFPGYANSNGAIGYFYIDTTAYDNGVHTIQWTARDSGNNSDGIGSRYFTIQNTGADAAQRAGQTMASPRISELSAMPVERIAQIEAVRGLDDTARPELLNPGNNGVATVEIKEMERVQLRFNSTTRLISEKPVGATMDEVNGVFYWSPGLAFVGDYDLTFFDLKTKRLRKVTVTILPKY